MIEAIRKRSGAFIEFNFTCPCWSSFGGDLLPA
jgi:hypothetical protein